MGQRLMERRREAMVLLRLLVQTVEQRRLAMPTRQLLWLLQRVLLRARLRVVRRLRHHRLRLLRGMFFIPLGDSSRGCLAATDAASRGLLRYNRQRFG